MGSSLRTRWLLTLALTLTGLLLASVTALGLSGGGTPPASSPIGPSLHITGNGHLLHPAGRLLTLGDFPDGSALTPGGRFLWVTDCGYGEDDVKIVQLSTRRVIQTLPLPGCYGGVAIAPDGRHAYVSGDPLAGNPTEGPTKGNQGDVVHVFTIDPATGLATEGNPLTIPATTGGSGRIDSLPPSNGAGSAQPEGLAVSPDGRYLVVALNAADTAAVFNLQSGTATTVAVGQYPEGVAFDPRGRAYVSNEYSGTVSVIDPASAKVTATITGLGGAAGDLASHPEGMVADPRRAALYVAVTNRDLVAVIDTSAERVTHLISVGRPEGVGTAPTSVAVSADGSTLYASDAGEDAVAAISLSQRPAAPKPHRVFRPPYLSHLRRYVRTHRRSLLAPRASLLACRGPSRATVRRFDARVVAIYRGRPRFWRRRLAAALRSLPRIVPCRTGYIPNLPAYRLIGRIPTAAYPDSVQVTPQGQLLWIAGKGFGSGPNPTYYFGGGKTQYTPPQHVYGTYVLEMLVGRLGILPVPTDRQVLADTATADAQARPFDAENQPAGSPVPASFGHPSAQIKHVFYIVRENRTYDQIFGSDPRGNGTPGLELFDNNGVAGPAGGITPNAHALASRFPLLDNFYEDSEVSVDGHLITAGGYATDYVQKATAANYSGRRGTYDFGIYPVTFAPNFFIFDQAVKQGVSFMDFGEAVGASPMGAAPNRPNLTAVLTHVDQAYPNNLFIGCLSAATPASCTQDSGNFDGTGTNWAPQSRVNDWLPVFDSELATGSVPTLTYMILPNDHTDGTTPNDPTPQAMVADNDLALGQIVDAISHSSIWSSSAIFVVEDDSQDGADHVDSHRAPAFVISPWAKQGAVVHTRFDQYSVLKTVELITGLQPLSLNDALATPMYDAFISGGEKPNDAPYTAIQPTYPLTAKNTTSSPNARLSAELPWNQLDQVPQAIADEILWHAVYGAKSRAPGAGPNPSLEEVARAEAVRRMLATPEQQALREWVLSGRRCPIVWACQKLPPQYR
jgi:YVTN family beta-propeller protein